MNWQDPTLVASIISAASTVFATLLGSISAALIGKRLLNIENLKKERKTAEDDIAFLLFVEEQHCRNNQKKLGRTYKMPVREAAREAGLTWSGRFTPGRVRAREQLGEHRSRLVTILQRMRAEERNQAIATEEKPDVAT